MFEKFKALSLVYKVVIIAVLFLLVLWVFDLTTGYVRQAKNYIFDSRQAKIEQQNKELESKNEELRKQIQEYLVEIEKLKIKEDATQKQIDAIGGKLKDNYEKTQQALEEVEKESAETQIPTDAKTRCLRLKEKLISLKIKGAEEMNCEDF